MAVILCVDDQEDSLTVRKLFLETFGYEVVTATTASAGLDVLAGASRIDLALLDYMLPDMTGEQLVRRVRALRPTIPIVLLSGYVGAMPPAVLRLVDGYLMKGAPAHELTERIEALIGAGSTRKTSASEILATSREQAQRVREQLKESRQLAREIRERHPRRRA